MARQKKDSAQQEPKKIEIKSLKKLQTTSVKGEIVELRDVTCMHCGEEKQSEFYLSNNPLHGIYGKIPLCKKCIQDIYSFYYEQSKHPVMSLYYTFQKIDTPLMSNIVNTITEAEIDKPEIVGKIMRQLRLPHNTGYLSFDDTDVMVDDTGGIDTFGDEYSNLDYGYLEFFWGSGFTPKEYVYLEKRYKSLMEMSDGVDLFESDTMLLKEICHTELTIRQLRERKSDYTKQSDSLQKLMASASIRSTDIKQAKSGELKNTYGVWVEQIEKNDPAEFFDKKPLYTDFDGLLKYLKKWVFRPLKNLLAGSRDFDVEGDD